LIRKPEKGLEMALPWRHQQGNDAPLFVRSKLVCIEFNRKESC
jgi:hypothetical protein